MTALTEVREMSTTSNITDGFMWKQARRNGGAMISPAQMDTSHLFFTLRMIWNHAMPPELWVGRNPRRYTFGPFYTERYMRRAAAALYVELETRQDLAPNLQAEYARMKELVRSPALERIT